MSRLRSRAEFLRAGARGRKAAMPGLVLQVFPRHDGSDDTRVGFTVTKKVGNAVVRNLVRRRLREVARLAFREAAPKGTDLVLIGRAGTIRRPFTDLGRDLLAALERTGAQPSRDRES